YYEVMQTRGVVGLPQAVREKVAALGLRRRNHVVWLRVDPRAAGLILDVRELVSVRLT
ncbi:hypothetical protein BDK51DRAFT_13791, partial [Blyttiomyces helicus]